MPKISRNNNMNEFCYNFAVQSPLNLFLDFVFVCFMLFPVNFCSVISSEIKIDIYCWLIFYLIVQNSLTMSLSDKFGSKYQYLYVKKLFHCIIMNAIQIHFVTLFTFKKIIINRIGLQSFLHFILIGKNGNSQHYQIIQRRLINMV